MSLWGFIPGKHIDKSGALPPSAMRLDTGEWVGLTGRDVDRANACGWWDLDNIDVAAFLAFAESRGIHFTSSELATLDAEKNAALFDRDQKRLYVDTAKDRVLAALTAYRDKLDRLDNPPPGPPFNTTDALIYLYNRVQYDALVMAGEGTFDKPGLLNLVDVLTEYVLAIIEQLPGFQAP